MDRDDAVFLFIIALILICALFVALVFMPWMTGLIADAKQTIQDENQPQVIDKMNYTGTLGMIQYERGWLGLGNIDKTHLTFTDGTQFTFGEITVSIGQNYTVTWEHVTYKSNRTKNRNYQISITIK